MKTLKKIIFSKKNNKKLNFEKTQFQPRSQTRLKPSWPSFSYSKVFGIIMEDAF